MKRLLPLIGLSAAIVALDCQGQNPVSPKHAFKVDLEIVHIDTISCCRDLEVVQFVDSTTGWAAGASRLYRTSDGGESWELLRSDFPAHDIDFLDHMNGWASGSFETVWRTTDGGIEWDTLTTRGLTGDVFGSLSVRSSGLAWVVGGGSDFVWRSHDSGATWSKLATGLGRFDGTVTEVFFISDSTGWFIHSNPSITTTVMTSTDSGSSWQSHDVGYGTWLSALHFVDERIGWLASHESIFKSTDGGISWTRQYDSTDMTLLSDIHFFDSLHGYAVGHLNHVFYTLDGGTNWLDVTDSIPNINGPWLSYTFRSVWMVSRTTAYIVGMGDGIFRVTISVN